MSRRTTIYIPGIGDRRRGLLWAQRLLLATWRLYGISPHVFVMDWASSASFETRFNELLTLIDRLHRDGRKVSLVGASAGASIVLLGLAERSAQVTGVATLCGQIATKEALAGPVTAANPRFKAALERWDGREPTLSASELQRVLTLRPKRDAVVPRSQEVLVGAVNHDMPIAGHMVGIGFGILCEGRRIAKFFASLD